MSERIDQFCRSVSAIAAAVWICFSAWHLACGRYDASIAFGVLALFMRSWATEERRNGT